MGRHFYCCTVGICRAPCLKLGKSHPKWQEDAANLPGISGGHGTGKTPRSKKWSRLEQPIHQLPVDVETLWNTMVGLRTLARSLRGVLPKIEAALLSNFDAAANHFESTSC